MDALSHVMLYEAFESRLTGPMKLLNVDGGRPMPLGQSLPRGTDLYSTFTALQYA